MHTCYRNSPEISTMTYASIAINMHQSDDHEPAQVMPGGNRAALLAQRVPASPGAVHCSNQWREQGPYPVEQLQDAASKWSMQNQCSDQLDQCAHLSNTYAELETNLLQIPNVPPEYQLSQSSKSTTPQESNDSPPYDHAGHVEILKAKHLRSLHRLQSHQANVDHALEAVRWWQESAESKQESAELEKACLQHLVLQLERAQYGRRQQKGQGGDYNRKNNTHDNGNSGTGQGRQEQPDDTKVPDFMREYVSGRPEAEEPPANEEPGVKRCSIGRPVGKKLERGTIYYHMRRCDKHLNKSVFDGNMKMQIEAQKSYKLVEHAWKCSGEATLRPLELKEADDTRNR